MKRLLLAVTALILTGCATKPPAAPFASAANMYDECMRSAANNPEYEPLKEKIALYKPGLADVAMLSNTSHISDEEKPIFNSWVVERKECFNTNETSIKNSVPPAVFDLIQTDVSNSPLMASELYSGRQSFGEYAHARIASTQRFQERMAKLRDQATAQNTAQNNLNEDRRRQAILMQLQMNQQRPQAASQQPYMIPVPTQTITNCRPLGDQIQCTTN